MTGQGDGGPIYMKHALSLEGSAQEILMRCSDIIFQEMIPVFLEEGKKLVPVPQEGEPVLFRRRKPEEGIITDDMELGQIYTESECSTGKGIQGHLWSLVHTGWSLTRRVCQGRSSQRV